MGHLDLRFPMFLWRLSIWTYAIECRIHSLVRLPSIFAHKYARDLHQRMNCDPRAILGVCKYASGEGSKHILIFHYFHEVRICYVFHGQSVTRIFCNKKALFS